MRRFWGPVGLLAVLSGCSGSAPTQPIAAAATATSTTATSTTATSATATSATAPIEPTSFVEVVTTPTPTVVTISPTTTEATVAVAQAPTIDELLAGDRPLVLAHAGGENAHPHSTPYAYADSVAAGVDVLDMDVQLTGDGVLVVQHDDTVDRTTNATGRVDSYTYAQLAELDNAYWFTATCTCGDQPEDAYILRGMRTGERPPRPGYAPDDFVIPRFRDIASRFPGLPLNIEIKGSGEPARRAAQVLADELAELGRLDSAVVVSFDDTIVETFHQMAPSVEVSPGQELLTAWVLSRAPLPDYMRVLQPPDVFGDVDVLANNLVATSHAVGYEVWVWPNSGRDTETTAGYERLLALGIDAINAADPAVAAAVVRR